MGLYYCDCDDEKTNAKKERRILAEINESIKKLNTTLVEAFLLDEDEPQEVQKEEIEFRQGYTSEMTLNFLDNNIRHWRRRRIAGDQNAKYYIDAYQSVRISLFSKELKRP